MTLIATFKQKDGNFVIFGDLLITGPYPPGRSFPLPAVSEISDYFGDAWHISGLSQKVVVIADNVAIAWAGQLIGARIAFNSLKEMSRSSVLTAEAVVHYLSNDPELKRWDLDFVGCIMEGRQCFQFGLGSVQVLDSPSLGKAYYAGSGAQVFEKTIRRDYEWFDSPATRGQPSQKDPSIPSAFALGAEFLAEELRNDGASASSLRTFFGGGYEIASLVEGRFQKIGVTHIFWKAEYGGDWPAKLSFPYFIILQDYVDDVLVLKAIRIAEVEGRLRVISNTVHIIGPMFSAPAPSIDRSPLTSLSKLKSHYIAFRNMRTGQSGVLSRITYDTPSVSLSLDGGVVMLEVDPAFRGEVVTFFDSLPK